jgi:hypothetical protein
LVARHFTAVLVHPYRDNSNANDWTVTEVKKVKKTRMRYFQQNFELFIRSRIGKQ